MLHVLTKNTKMSPTFHWQVNQTPDSTHWKGVATHWKGLYSLKGTSGSYLWSCKIYICKMTLINAEKCPDTHCVALLDSVVTVVLEALSQLPWESCQLAVLVSYESKLEMPDHRLSIPGHNGHVWQYMYLFVRFPPHSSPSFIFTCLGSYLPIIRARN